jgi:hypothetical protein
MLLSLLIRWVAKILGEAFLIAPALCEFKKRKRSDINNITVVVRMKYLDFVMKWNHSFTLKVTGQTI